MENSQGIITPSHLRIRALELAVQLAAASEQAERTTERASAFLAFLDPVTTYESNRPPGFLTAARHSA